tara:strand:- start:99 stop:407 length:309 start_codon:yes stop_codon:yes gene_type:complete
MDEDECMICLEELKGSLCKLSCGHIYHYNCVQKWLINKKEYRNSCCICKNTEIINIYNTNELLNYPSNLNLINKDENNPETNNKRKKYKRKLNIFNKCCIIL